MNTIHRTRGLSLTVIYLNQTFLPVPIIGSSRGNEDARPQPYGAGDHRPDQQHREERLHLLPRVLRGHSEEVPRGG